MRNKLGSRPHFSTAIKRQLRQDTARLHMKHVDACHRIPYKLICENFMLYLNKKLSRQSFLDFVDLLFDVNLPPTAQKNEVLLLLRTANLEKNLPVCRRILSLLNSAAPNLRPGDSSFNRSIGAKLDLAIVDYRFTPQSKRALAALREKELLPVTTTGQIRTSFFSTGQRTPTGKVVTPERLTPYSLALTRILADQPPQQDGLTPETDTPSRCSIARSLFSRC